MVELQLDETNGIATLKPLDALQSADIDSLTDRIDHYIDEHGILRGLLIDARSFPGWKDYHSLVRHLQFVDKHHSKVARVALVSDTLLLSIIPAIADFFVHADIRHFDYKNMEKAKQWLYEE